MFFICRDTEVLHGQTSGTSRVTPAETKIDFIFISSKKEAAAAAGGGGEKKPDKKKKSGKKKIDNEKPPKESTVVLKIKLHCEGCINKHKKTISKIKGVENLTVDGARDLVTVKGTMDAKELAPYLKKKLKKPVEVVPPAKKDDGGGEKNGKAKETAPAKDKAVAAGGGRDGAKDEYYGCPYPQPENRSENKPGEKKTGNKKPPKENKVVLKIGLHCEGCIKKIKKKISTSKGVENVTIDSARDLVTVKGTMDAKELAPYLEEKLKRTVEVVHPAKKDDSGEKKDNKEAAGGGENKEAGAKIEYYGYPYPYPQPENYWYDGNL
ncbi:hypothetical protein EZV62_016289 [Acer yangbiense]|uniref:HMA domain-containing protein n=1 Tax=Acer yangbiense TaxID=1000413 RepID=A0A5C7HN39_9ROSI|nr:hypothetical protein EZV62_016289 [Acer yangbiense]